MDLYQFNDKSLEDPFLASYADVTYYERYGEEEEEPEEPWAVYDPF